MKNKEPTNAHQASSKGGNLPELVATIIWHGSRLLPPKLQAAVRSVMSIFELQQKVRGLDAPDPNRSV